MSDGDGYTTGELSYGSYLKIPELLNLQECRSDPQAPDELLFIVIHQAYELWFKEILFELDKARDRLRDDDMAEATRLLRRVNSIEDLLVQQIHLLETMRPRDFLKFRSELQPASGFQSVQFREVEFLSGMKDRDVMRGMDFSERERKTLERRLEESSLRVELYRFLKRNGFDVAIPDTERGFDDNQRARTLEQIQPVYKNPDDHPDIYRLTETLLEHDRNLQLWRFHHVRVVERLIGHKPGTGKTEGVGYLETTLEKRGFPVLWSVRSHI